MTAVLRRATVDDLDAIMRIETATFPEDAWSTSGMRSELRSPHTWYLVAEDPETGPETGACLVGYAGLLAPLGAEQADVQTIAVVETARRRGLGRALMTAMLAEARTRGALEVFLEVRADNPAARTLYDELGFEQIALRPKYYQPSGVDAIIMRLTVPRERAGESS